MEFGTSIRALSCSRPSKERELIEKLDNRLEIGLKDVNLTLKECF
jgi:hypothetical protein